VRGSLLYTDPVIALFFGAFGLIIGSFLNVVVLRHGHKSLGGRSGCLSCGHQIAWYDNIPVISWLILGGRCRHCGSAISIQYPIVESVTGILFAVLGYALFDFTVASAVEHVAPALLIAAFLILIATYDVRHTIIPDAWVYTFALLAILWGYFFVVPQVGPFYFLIAGPLASLPLYLIWLVSGGRWMGFGDVKLALGIGWLLGPLYGPLAIFFSFIVGALFSVPLLLLSSGSLRRFIARFTPTLASRRGIGGFTMTSEIPFGPFLIASCIIIWLLLIFHVDPLRLIGLLP
jgi:leader peptidase (prepilin peptidase)/N-methyltransferase